MNYTAIPKSITTFQTGNNKPLDIYVWAYIKLCSNHQANKSDITEDKLSKLTGIPLRTIVSSIKRLKDGGYLNVQTRILKQQGCKKRNSYHFMAEKQNFFMIDNGFFHKAYKPRIAGFMLLIRSITINNTDKVLWTITKIAEEISISRNTTSDLLKECQTLKLIKSISGGYEITEDCLKWNAVHNKANNPIYKAICDFCESKGATPPMWDKDAMSVIQTKYNSADLPPYDEHNISYQLNKRCLKLPTKVTMAYFVKVLGMEVQYKALIASKSVKKDNDFPFPA